MDPFEGDQPVRQGTFNPPPHFDGSTPYRQSDRPIVDPHTNPERFPDNFPGSQYATRYRQSGQNMHGEYIQGEGDIYGPSPFPTERSWGTRDGYWTPQLPPKRGRSPSSMDHFPNKRHRAYDSPGMMPPPPMPRGMCYQGPLDADRYWDTRQHTAGDLGVIHPSSAPSSSQRSIDLNRYDHTAHQSSPYGYEARHSTPQSTYYRNPRPYMNNAVQTPDQRFAPRAHTIALGARRNYQDVPSRIPLLSSSIEQAKPPLRSPLWMDKASREQPRQVAQSYSQTPKSNTQTPQTSSKTLKSTTQPPKSDTQTPQTSTKTPKKNKELAAERVYPFDDGGVRGEGGSSSDEDTMMFPVVEGRNVHMGGHRYHEAVDKKAYKTGPSDDFTPLDSAIDLDELWQATDRVDRRRKKLTARDFRARWLTAKENGDVVGMERLERRAKKAEIPLRKEPAENTDASPQATSPRSQVAQALHLPEVPSPTAQCEYDIRFPENGALVPYGEQPTPNQYPSQELLKYATEGNQSRSQSLHTQTPNLDNGGRSKNRHLQASESPYQTDQYGFQGSPAEQDSTLWEQTFRRSQQNSQRTNVNATPYRAENVLPKASISYNDRPNPVDINDGPRQPPILAYSGEEGPLGDAQVFKSKERSMRPPPIKSGSQTPLSQVRPPAGASEYQLKSSPVVIDLLSSAENSPVQEPSKPMRDRIAPPSAKGAAPKQSKLNNTARRPSKKDFAKEQIDPEEARQQRAADLIIATELKAVNDELFGVIDGGEDLEAIALGVVLDLTPEQEEALVEAKRKEAQRKEEAKLLEETAKEDARLTELKKQKAIAEAREKERLVKEREEQSKKLKREQERKKQLALEDMVREEKRKQAVARIEVQRAKDRADAEAREKEKEKSQSVEVDKLKIEIMRKDLEVKKLQAASLSVAKASSLEAPKDSATKAMSPIPLAKDDNSLFVPETTQFKDVDMADVDVGSGARSAAEIFGKHTTFRNMIAEDREKLQAERAVEGRKRAEATRRRFDAIRKSAEPVKEKPKRPKRPKWPKRSRSTPKYNAKSSSEEPQNVPATLSSIFGVPKQSKLVPDRPASAPIPALPAPKTYSSEVRLISEVDLEKDKKKREAREKAAKLQRLAERRQRELPQIALKQRKKLLEEANNGGYNLTEQELNIRVDLHMKKLEEAYQKKQAKKALQSGVAFGNSPLSQPQTQQESFSSSKSSETEHCNTGTVTQEPKSLQAELPENIAAAKRERGGRYAQAVSKRTVSDLAADLQQSDSEEESEEDPDDDETLEAIIAATTGDKSPTQGSEKQTTDAGALNPNDRGTQRGDGTNDGDESQRATSQPSANSSESKVADSQSEKPTQEEDRRIKIYRVKKMETKDGQELDESISPEMLTSRQEANDMAKEMLKQYRDQAAREEQSFAFVFKDSLYCGTAVLDDQNSMTVEVVSEFSKPSKFGLDVSRMNNLHGEKVWVIKRQIKKTGKDEDGNTVITHSKEDVNDLVYTDRKLANHKAADALIAFLKPPEGLDIEFEEAWANTWSPSIRETEKATKEADECFAVELDPSDLGDAEWLEWDSAAFMVEVRKTAGPRN